MPVAEVEQTIRDACRRWQVAEVVADPFRWTRTLQALEAEGLPVVEFPHSPARLTAATRDLFSAAVNGNLTHSGDPKLAAHVAAAVVTEDARGIRLSKTSRSRTARKIDLAACLVMAHSRATWRATRRPAERLGASPHDRPTDDPASGLDETTAAYTELDHYYAGNQPLAFLSPEAKTALGTRFGRMARTFRASPSPPWPSGYG